MQYSTLNILQICLMVLVVFSSSFVIETAFAENEFEIIGETLTHDPTICALEPEIKISDGWKKLSQYTRWAVLDWENQLNQHTRAKDVWNLNLQYVTVEKQKMDFECDITIEFLPKPQNEEDEFQIAGYTENHSKDNVDIVIFYLNIELDRVDYTESSGQSGFYYSVVEWNPRYTDYLANEEPLKMTIKHELGHALGLGHYITDDEDDLQRWYEGIVRPPSIMIPTKPTKVISADITQLDVEMITRIYGKDGFYSEEKIDELYESIIPNSSRTALPDWIKNNAKWWSEGIISDKDFATGIEHMIKNKIIDVPFTGTNNFSVEQKIPDWIKNNAKWWSEGIIPSDEFVRGLQFLVNNGIIRV